MQFIGVVQKGDRRGTSFGFPTANIIYEGTESGIYAANVMLDGIKYDAAAYADVRRKVLEVHLGKYSGGDLYGKEITVSLKKKIREDKIFEDETLLREQIAADVQAVRQYFLSSK